MFSTRSAVFISTCSVGIGILIGRRAYGETKFNKDYFIQDGATYVFPTASAKSLIGNNDNKNLPLVPKSPRSPAGSSHSNLPANSVGETVKYGFPSLENVRSYEDFILSYDKRNRTANWVLEHLTPEKVEKSNVNRAQMKFVEDESFHIYHRATNKDFLGSGYDRGHLAAAANHRQSKSAMSQTFILSNVAPQVGEGFNRDAWNNLEKYTRAIARRSKNVYVCTGPLFLPRLEHNGKLFVKYEVIGSNHVAVPTHFFKVLLIENEKGEKELQSFVLPNQSLADVKLKQYLVPVETIERAAGLHFFDKVPKNTLKKINALTTK